MARDDAQRTLDMNKGYAKTGYAERVYHLHIKQSGDWDELYFRDYLQAHPDVARQYETLKFQSKARYAPDRDAYTNAKSEFVLTYSRKARREFEGRYLPEGR